MGGLLLERTTIAFVIFEALEQDFDFVADLDVLVFEFVGGDGAFGLVADVHKDDLGFDFEDATLDDGSLGDSRKEPAIRSASVAFALITVVYGLGALGG